MNYSLGNYISSRLKVSFPQDCSGSLSNLASRVAIDSRLILGFCLHIFTNHGSNALKNKSHMCTELVQTVLIMMYFVLFLN